MALGRSYGWLASAIALSAGGCGFDVGVTATDASVDIAPPDEMPPPELPLSCKGLHQAQPTKPSGVYDIDPDGTGSTPKLSVTCDMTTAGGGWTLIFVAANANLANANLAYDVVSDALMTAATESLVAYRDGAMASLPNAATFALPQKWRTQSPFTYASEDQNVMVSIDGGPSTQKSLRFGNTTFANNCDDIWNTTVQYGRLCIQGTPAPFYTGFTVSEADTCSDSQSNWNAAPCTPAKRFTIAVR
jgi:hypothetical protein